MKKLSIVSSLLVVVLSSILIYGCTEQQKTTVANQAGLYSAVMWIAIDNPALETIELVHGIVGKIKESSSAVQAGQSYTEVLYPIIQTYVDDNIPANQKPLCLAATISLLGGIDLLFANPSWNVPEGEIISIVYAYCDGAMTGLGMSRNEKTMKIAANMAERRKQALNQ